MSDPREMEGLEDLDQRQTEMDDRGLDFQAYWQKREADMKAQRAFWGRWNNRWNVNTDWPFRRT